MKIGNRTVLISETIFLPDGEAAELEAAIRPDDILRLRLQASHDGVAAGQEMSKPQINWDLIDGVFQFNFKNFTQALGAATNSATVFGQSDIGEPISYWAVIYRLTSITKIELQIAIERKP